jgi:hypothetical protein
VRGADLGEYMLEDEEGTGLAFSEGLMCHMW